MIAKPQIDMMAPVPDLQRAARSSAGCLPTPGYD
jgi:hypothetical protein